MLSQFRPGRGWLHRMPAGRKLALLSVAAIVLSVLPSTWQTVLIAMGSAVTIYAVSGLGWSEGLLELAKQSWALRWVIVITITGQLVFLGVEPALANTARVLASLLVVGLLPLTTSVSDVLDVLEHALTPLRVASVDPARIALLLTLTITTLPVLARLVNEVRDAQRARGLRPTLRRAVLPLMVVTLKHADALGEGLSARGIQ